MVGSVQVLHLSRMEVNMNYKKSVGVNLDGGVFDDYVLDSMRKRIREIYKDTQELNEKPTRAVVAEALDMDRWRLSRLLKALDITDLF